MIAILMGVTGTGKTTIARGLAARTGWEFAEGDDYHSEANKAKMRAGIPLTDGDREPWLQALHEILLGWAKAGKNGVMTCSALKESYRKTLSADIPEGVIRFVLLEAPKQVLAERLERRTGHFMNPALLDSQLATLELPENAVDVSVVGTPAQSVDQIMEKLGLAVKQ